MSGPTRLGAPPQEAELGRASGGFGNFFNRADRGEGVRNLKAWVTNLEERGMGYATVEKVPISIKRRFHQRHDREDAEAFRKSRAKANERMKENCIFFGKQPKNPARFRITPLKACVAVLEGGVPQNLITAGAPSGPGVFLQKMGAPQGSAHGKAVAGASFHSRGARATDLRKRGAIRKRYEDDTFLCCSKFTGRQTADDLLVSNTYVGGLGFKIEGNSSTKDRRSFVFIGISISIRGGKIAAVYTSNSAGNLTLASSYTKDTVKLGAIIGMLKAILYGAKKHARGLGLLYCSIADLVTKLEQLGYSKEEVRLAFKRVLRGTTEEVRRMRSAPVEPYRRGRSGKGRTDGPSTRPISKNGPRGQ